MLRPRLLIAASCLALAAPAAASAATVNDSGARMVVTAADGEVNHISIMQMDVGPILVRDTGDVAIGGCAPFSHPEFPAAGQIICYKPSPIVDLGDRDDSVGIADPGTWATIGASQVDGGEGDDTIAAGAADDHFDGGPGNDTLRPNLGDDTVIGGTGDDVIDAFYGKDTIDVRDGAGGDQVVCGEDEDTVQADAGDTIAADCEHVTRVGGETPPPVDENPGPVDDGKTPTNGPKQGDGPGPVPGTGTVPGTQQGGSTSTADTRAPLLTVTRKRLRGGKVRLTLRCDEACTITAKAKRAKRTVTLLAGKQRSITLRARGRAKVRLTAVDAAGNRTVRKR